MTSDGRHIVLTGTGESRAIEPTRVYFPFADGRFSYDCQSCGAQCCKGHGYLLGTEHETLIQIRRRPSLRMFLEPCESSGTHYHVHNCAPACFFLDDDSRCQIHRLDGAAAKPETCRLFPFNYMRLVGNYLVVAPHTGLCPLRIAPSTTRDDASRHANLMRELTAREIGGHVPVAVPLIADVDRLIGLERAIVELSERYLDTRDYIEFLGRQQCEQNAAWPGVVDAPPLTVEQRTDALRQHASTMRAILGVDTPDAEAEQAVTTNLVVSTPSLRAVLLFLDRDPGDGRVGVDQIPRVLLALHTLALLAAAAGMQQVTYQTLMRLLREYRYLLDVLASLDCVFTWKEDALIDLAAEADSVFKDGYLRIVHALAPAVQRRRRLSLGAILAAHVGGEGLGRVLFVKRLARRLAPHLTVLTDVADPRRWWRHPRASVQQWAVGRSTVAEL